MKKKACFLDRDGVVIVDKDYLCDVNEVQLTENAAQAIKKLNDANYIVIIVSNQSGVARGYFSEASIDGVHNQICKLIATDSGAVIDKFYYCPHHKHGTIAPFNIDCDCRKPKLGMFEQSLNDFDIDVANSVMVGDKVSDVLAGNNIGCKRSFLVKTGHGIEELAKLNTSKNSKLKFTVAENLAEAVENILNLKNDIK